MDYLNGEVVLLARRHGVPAPVNTALQRLLGTTTGTTEAGRLEDLLAADAALV